MVINIVVAVIVFLVVLLHFVVTSVFDVACCNFKHLSVLIVVTLIGKTVIVLLKKIVVCHWCNCHWCNCHCIVVVVFIAATLTDMIYFSSCYLCFFVVVVLFGSFVLIPVVTFCVQISFHRYFAIAGSCSCFHYDTVF